MFRSVCYLQLFDILFREETLLNVIRSVTKNARSLLLTFLLALILIYMFSLVGYLLFQVRKRPTTGYFVCLSVCLSVSMLVSQSTCICYTLEDWTSHPSTYLHALKVVAAHVCLSVCLSVSLSVCMHEYARVCVRVLGCYNN